MLEDYLNHWQTTLDWQPSAQQLQLLEQLYQLVLEGNQTQNLTRITSVPDFWEKHLWDSLRGILTCWHDRELKVIDIGTGAGFPGLPVAIAQPTWQVTLLDSTQKKMRFVETAIAALDLKNAIPLTGRAEEMWDEFYTYDLVLVRAVGDVNLCANYALPFLKPGGKAILYRGNWTEAEEKSLSESSDRFNAKIIQVEKFETPLTQGLRHCVLLNTSDSFRKKVKKPFIVKDDFQEMNYQL
jgi:16S rRNA (guanine527-N7)-methyltransferase